MTETADPLLGEANQFLRYRIASKDKLDRQGSLTKALWSKPEWPPARLVIFEDRQAGAEFRWLVAKTGSHADLQLVRSLAQDATGPTFKAMFGDAPFSSMWADHIAENCPGPGEAVTPHGQEVYRSLLSHIQSGRYVVIESWDAAGVSGPPTLR